MVPAHHRKSSNVIVVAGVLLGLYLAALIAVGYVGQSRLHQALVAQELLSSEKQATAVAYFLSDLQDSLDQLSESGQIQTFLADRKPGVPMGSSQRAGLLAVSRDLERFRDRKRIHGEPAFSRIAFVENNGHLLLEVGSAKENRNTGNYRVIKTAGPSRMQIKHDAQGATLTFTTAVVHGDKPAGYLAAAVDADKILRPFLADRDDSPQQARTALLGPQDGVVAAGIGQDWSRWRSEALDRVIPC